MIGSSLLNLNVNIPYELYPVMVINQYSITQIISNYEGSNWCGDSLMIIS